MIYISGKISGTTDWQERFAQAQADLEAEGNRVINPAAVCSTLPDGLEWWQYMTVCIPLLEMCNTVFLLDGWEQSKGAVAELKYATQRGKEIIHQRDWRERDNA